MSGHSEGILAVCDEFDQFRQHAEFKLQLDGVHHAFEGGFDLVQVHVFDREKGGIQDDEGNVDDEQLPHQFSSMALGCFLKVP